MRNFRSRPLKLTTPLILTLVEELLNQVDSKQAKQLQTKFLYCLNCYLTCILIESSLEKLLLIKLKEGELKLHAWAVAEEAGVAQGPPEPYTGHAPGTSPPTLW